MTTVQFLELHNGEKTHQANCPLDPNMRVSSRPQYACWGMCTPISVNECMRNLQNKDIYVWNFTYAYINFTWEIFIIVQSYRHMSCFFYLDFVLSWKPFMQWFNGHQNIFMHSLFFQMLLSKVIFWEVFEWQRFKETLQDGNSWNQKKFASAAPELEPVTQCVLSRRFVALKRGRSGFPSLTSLPSASFLCFSVSFIQIVSPMWSLRFTKLFP